MDAILTAVLGASPELGGAGVLLSVLVILVRRETQTTERHSTEIARMAQAHDKEMARQAGAHDDELAEIRAELTRARAERDSAEQQVDAQRQLRRQAQEQQWTGTQPTQTQWPPQGYGRSSPA